VSVEFIEFVVFAAYYLPFTVVDNLTTQLLNNSTHNSQRKGGELQGSTNTLGRGI